MQRLVIGAVILSADTYGLRGFPSAEGEPGKLTEDQSGSSTTDIRSFRHRWRSRNRPIRDASSAWLQAIEARDGATIDGQWKVVADAGSEIKVEEEAAGEG